MATCVRFLTVSLLTYLAGSVAWAAEEYEYPELVVTPLASERLQREAAEEPSFDLMNYSPTILSGALTLTAGAIQSGAATEDVRSTTSSFPVVAIGVGSAWVGLGVVMAGLYHPYASSWSDVSKMPSRTKRERLAKERAAEEAISSAGRMGRKLTWLSVISNFTVNTMLLTNAKVTSLSFGLAVGGLIGSLAPAIFSYHWGQVQWEQNSYKKRIYGTVAQGAALWDQGRGSYVPGVALTMNF